MKCNFQFFFVGAVIGFSQEKYYVDENGGNVIFTVVLSGSVLSSSVVVNFFTEDGASQGIT